MLSTIGSQTFLCENQNPWTVLAPFKREKLENLVPGKTSQLIQKKLLCNNVKHKGKHIQSFIFGHLNVSLYSKYSKKTMY